MGAENFDNLKDLLAGLSIKEEANSKDEQQRTVLTNLGLSNDELLNNKDGSLDEIISEKITHEKIKELLRLPKPNEYHEGSTYMSYEMCNKDFVVKISKDPFPSAQPDANGSDRFEEINTILGDVQSNPHPCISSIEEFLQLKGRWHVLKERYVKYSYRVLCNKHEKYVNDKTNASDRIKEVKVYFSRLAFQMAISALLAVNHLQKNLKIAHKDLFGGGNIRGTLKKGEGLGADAKDFLAYIKRPFEEVIVTDFGHAELITNNAQSTQKVNSSVEPTVDASASVFTDGTRSNALLYFRNSARNVDLFDIATLLATPTGEIQVGGIVNEYQSILFGKENENAQLFEKYLTEVLNESMKIKKPGDEHFYFPPTILDTFAALINASPFFLRKLSPSGTGEGQPKTIDTLAPHAFYELVFPHELVEEYIISTIKNVDRADNCYQADPEKTDAALSNYAASFRYINGAYKELDELIKKKNLLEAHYSYFIQELFDDTRKRYEAVIRKANMKVLEKINKISGSLKKSVEGIREYLK